MKSRDTGLPYSRDMMVSLEDTGKGTGVAVAFTGVVVGDVQPAKINPAAAKTNTSITTIVLPNLLSIFSPHMCNVELSVRKFSATNSFN
jgi:hypothetical protein